MQSMLGTRNPQPNSKVNKKISLFSYSFFLLLRNSITQKFELNYTQYLVNVMNIIMSGELNKSLQLKRFN